MDGAGSTHDRLDYMLGK